MTSAMALSRADLEFVSIGTGKVHARQNGPSSHNPAINLSAFTLCGRRLPEEAHVLRERSVETDALCGKCYMSLRTYTSGVHVEREAQV